MTAPACLLAVLLFFTFGCNTLHPAANSGIEGEVLRAPTCGGPVSPGRRCEDPLAGTFHVYNAADEPIATFTTDADGRFRLALPPGDYTVVPDAATPIMGPTRQRKPVVVKAEGYTVLRLVFDTGIR